MTIINDKLLKSYTRKKEQSFSPLNSEKLDSSSITEAGKKLTKNCVNFSEFDLMNQCGNLVPLSCGHNGSLNKKEIQVYEYHLKTSGFL